MTLSENLNIFQGERQRKIEIINQERHVEACKTLRQSLIGIEERVGEVAKLFRSITGEHEGFEGLMLVRTQEINGTEKNVSLGLISTDKNRKQKLLDNRGNTYSVSVNNGILFRPRTLYTIPRISEEGEEVKQTEIALHNWPRDEGDSPITMPYSHYEHKEPDGESEVRVGIWNLEQIDFKPKIKKLMNKSTIKMTDETAGKLERAFGNINATQCFDLNIAEVITLAESAVKGIYREFIQLM